MSVTIEAVKAALSSVIDPNTGKDLVSSKSARNIRLEGADVLFDVELDYRAIFPLAHEIDGDARNFAGDKFTAQEVGLSCIVS